MEAERHRPNVLLVHYNNLLTDLGAELRRVARFLEIDVDEVQVPAMLEHCSIDYMRDAVPTDSGINMIFEGGGKTFFHKGTNGRWRELL
jgi:aryl sulfotransferase